MIRRMYNLLLPLVLLAVLAGLAIPAKAAGNPTYEYNGRTFTLTIPDTECYAVSCNSTVVTSGNIVEIVEKDGNIVVFYTISGSCSNCGWTGSLNLTQSSKSIEYNCNTINLAYNFQLVANGQPVSNPFEVKLTAPAQHLGLVDGTCTEAEHCTACNTTTGTINPDNHAFSEEWSFDGTHHWHECTREGCQYVSNYLYHSYTAGYVDNGDGTHSPKCECGAVDGNAEDHSVTSWSIDASDPSKHTGTCTVCAGTVTKVHSFGDWNHDSGAQTHSRHCVCSFSQTEDCAGTDPKDCTKAINCDQCGNELRAAGQHSYNNACDTDCNACGSERTITHDYQQQSDDTQHWRECSVCRDKKDAADHSFDNACDTDCNVCGAVRTAAHDYQQQYDAAQHWMECAVCRDKKDAAEHSFDDDLDSACNVCPFTRQVSYTMIKGASQVVYKEHRASFTSNAPYAKFLAVAVDGETLDGHHYTLEEGDTTKVTLKGSYTRRLRVGKHTLTIVSQDGEASANFTIKVGQDYYDRYYDTDAPKTGDTTNNPLWIAIAAIGIVGLLTSILGKKYLKKRR